MRTNRGILRALLGVCGAAVIAAPAAAEVPAEPDKLAAESLFPYVGKDSPRNQTGRDPVPREPRGPFHPLDSKPDYGTADNAFGASRSDHVHEGQDVFAPAGTPLVSVSDAVVAEAGSDGEQGNYAYLYDPKAKRTYVYMHMVEAAEVKTGEQVRAGQRIGGVGCTGSCWGDHLHFEVHAGRGIAGEAQDPLPLLHEWNRVPAK